MGRSNVKLPHFAFFEALAQCESETCEEWRTTSAGLVTLRLFDDWVEDGAGAVSSDSWTLRCVRESISAIDSRNDTRTLLTSLVDSMQLARNARVALVVPRLMEYARALQLGARWTLAADVYRTLLANVDSMTDKDVVITANMQLGACLRVLADWSPARQAYATAAEVAAFAGDVSNVLKARIAEANVMMAQGNLPAAEKILDAVIERSHGSGFAELRASALQDRGVIARQRGEIETAVSYAYEALSTFADPIAKDRALGDLGTIFFDIGLLGAARDAHLMLAATASEQYTRWVATLNLLEIAVIDRREPMFEQYRRELADEGLPMTLLAYYHYYVGRGYQIFERPELAKASFECAISTASRHQINEVLIKAEQGLSELRRGGKVADMQTVRMRLHEPSARVAEVAGAIHEMRTLAGVVG